MTLTSAALILFIVMDPLGNLPLFVSALSDVKPERIPRVVLRESFIALAVLAFFLVSGGFVLGLFGLSEVALRLGGGAVLFLIAVRMIFPVEGGIFGPDGGGEPLVVPLAVPLIAGPSSLCVVLLMSAEESLGVSHAFLALFLAWGAATVVHLLAHPLRRLVGARGLVAIERLMGLILVAVAVQMVLDALGEAGVL